MPIRFVTVFCTLKHNNLKQQPHGFKTTSFRFNFRKKLINKDSEVNISKIIKVLMLKKLQNTTENAVKADPTTKTKKRVK